MLGFLRDSILLGPVIPSFYGLSPWTIPFMLPLIQQTSLGWWVPNLTVAQLTFLSYRHSHLLIGHLLESTPLPVPLSQWTVPGFPPWVLRIWPVIRSGIWYFLSNFQIQSILCRHIFDAGCSYLSPGLPPELPKDLDLTVTHSFSSLPSPRPPPPN